MLWFKSTLNFNRGTRVSSGEKGPIPILKCPKLKPTRKFTRYPTHIPPQITTLNKKKNSPSSFLLAPKKL